MNNNLTLSVTLRGDGRQLTGTLRNAQGEVREFGDVSVRDNARATGAFQRTERSVGSVNNQLNEMNRVGQMARNALLTLGGAIGIREVIGYSDAWTNAENQLRQVTRTSAELEAIQGRLVDLARETRSSYDATANLYSRLSRATTELNLTQEDLLGLTTSINKSFATNGATVQEASAAITQLSQGLAAGALRGDEFNSVAEQAPGIMRAIASSLNMTIGELREFAAEGGITAEIVVNALQQASDTIDQDFAKTIATFSQNLEVARTNLMQWIGTSGEVSLAVDTLGGSVVTVSEHLDELVAIAQVGALLFAGRYAGAIAASQAALTAKAAIAATTTGVINLLTGATTRQATAATAMAGATRAATGAMTLLGGPVGLLVGAGGLLYMFREEIGLVRSTVEPTTQRIDNLTDALNRNSVAAVEAGIVNMASEYFVLGQRAAAAAAEIEKLTVAQENDRQGAQARLQNNMRLRDMREALAQITTEQEAAGKGADELRQVLHGLGETVVETTNSTTELGAESETAAAKTNELTKATEAQAEAIEALRNRLRPGRSEVVQLAKDQNTLNLAFAMGRIGVSEYLQLMGALQQAHMETGETAKEAADQISVNVSTWATVSENAIRRVDDAGVDLWLGLIDGSRNAMDTVKRGIQQSLAEIAHMLTTQRLTVAIAGSLGINTGGAGGISGAGSSGGFGINPGSINNAWQALQGGIGGIQWGGVGSASAYGGTGFANAATSGLGQTGFMGGSMQNLQGMQGLAGLGAGFAGNWLGSQMFGEGKHSSTLGTIGGLAGTYFGGPLGALAGSTLGSALGGIFGGSWETKDAGLNLGVSGGDITGNQYERQKKSGGWFSSSKSRTRTSSLDGELDTMLQDAYAAQEASLAVTLETLGQQSSALNAFSSGLTQISTKGMDEAEVEQAVQDWLQSVVNSAAQSVTDPSQYARSGETTVETLNRLASALGSINPILEQLHETSLAASLAGGDAASHLADLAGGIDAFSSRADYYYQNILTEAERQERAMNAAAQAMGGFTARTGVVINSTDQLRELVDGIDLTTASGRELYNEAMNLAPALVEIERGLELVGQQFDQLLADANATLNDAQQQARQALQAFNSQAFDQQIELLNLMGDAEGALALERERELATIDESLRPTKERIWAIQDEIAAQQNATAAARNYQRELVSVRDQLNQQFAQNAGWLDQQQATDGAPETNLATAQEQLARQLVLAENGDRNALQSITQYADRVLEANQAYNASSAAGQRIQEDVYDAIRALPDAITAEEYLAEEIRNALFDALDGKATNDDIQALMTSVANGDMTLEAALQRVYGVSEGTEANTDSMEKQARDQLRELNGLVGEMTRTTDQFVGLNSTMVSLQDSINALGVAQKEIARIEKERIAAEKAERDRIAREREAGINAQRNTIGEQLNEARDQYASYQGVIEKNRDANVISQGRSGNYQLARGGLAQHYNEHSNVQDATSLSALLSGNTTAIANPRGLSSIDRVNQLLSEYNNALRGMGSIENTIREYERQLAALPTVNGSHATGLWNVPFDGYVAELHKDEMVVPANTAGRLRDLPDRAPTMGAMSLPSFPLLGNNDVLETLRDLKREVAELRRDNAQLQSESNKHLAAANNQRGAAAKGQIGAIERGNKMLKRMEDDKRLEAAKR